MSWITIIGYIAACLVGATFYTKSMVSLRCFAIASNICFIIYSSQLELYPVFLLHVFLLPLNISRLWQLIKRKPIQMEWLHHPVRPSFTPKQTSITL